MNVKYSVCFLEYVVMRQFTGFNCTRRFRRSFKELYYSSIWGVKLCN